MPHFINTGTLCLESGAAFPSKYAILSHTWRKDEMEYEDMTPRNTQFFLRAKKRCTKLQFAVQIAKKLGHEYLWMDTCCIDKSSTVELSEAINSMYKYYKNSGLCIAYLEDVKTREDLPKARWFTRGWTLQELIFSPHIQFFGAEGVYIGSKKSLLQDLSSITGIDASILTGEVPLESVSVAHRMSWLANRKTSRPEDLAYCMLGIFGITMQICYGEGEEAFRRLQAQLLSEKDDHSLLAWNGPASRWGAIADSPRVFANTCACMATNNLEFTTRAQLRTDLSGIGLSTTLICWMADPTDWTRWYAVVENVCATHPDQPAHVIELRQLHPRKLHFVRVHSEKHLVYGDPTHTLQSQIIFEEESFRSGRLLKESPYYYEGVRTSASFPAPDYPTIENHPWQVDLLNDDHGKRFYRADVCPRYRDIVIRFSDPSGRLEESETTTDTDEDPNPEVRFEPSRLASFNKRLFAAESNEEASDSIQQVDQSPSFEGKISGTKTEIYDIFKTIIDDKGYVVEDDWFLVVDTQGTETKENRTCRGFLRGLRNKL